MENEELAILDKIKPETNIYRLVVAISEKARHLNRNKLENRRSNPIKEVLHEILEEKEPLDF
ncbi:MAG: DNA-directed RNA polymerase subunit omega [Candidatus Omnitrophota bacterium]